MSLGRRRPSQAVAGLDPDASSRAVAIVKPSGIGARSGCCSTSRERLVPSSMPASAGVTTTPRSGGGWSGRREAPGSARACRLVPASSYPDRSVHAVLPHTVERRPSRSARDESDRARSTLRSAVTWCSRGRRSNGRSWPTAPRLSTSVTGSRTAPHLPGLRAPAGDASARRRRRAGRADPSAAPPTVATAPFIHPGARCSPPSNGGAGQHPAACLSRVLRGRRGWPAGGRCALHPDQFAAQGQARAMMQPVDRGLGAAHAVGDLSRG